MSKDLKPKIRLGQTAATRRKRMLFWAVFLLAGGGAAVAAWRYNRAAPTVEVPVARVRRGDFVIAVKTRGEVRSVRSVVLAAPQVPNPRITHLLESGKMVQKGEVVVEFDTAQQEQNLLEKATGVRTVDSEITQTKASHRITDESDGMNKMTAEYNLERSKLEAGKAEVVSQIEGAKSRIDVTVSEGELGQVHTSIQSHGTEQKADLDRLGQKKDKAVRDLDRTRGYLSKMVLRAPNDGIVNVLPNFRSSGSFGAAPPAFKEGDSAWTGASIAEIPDLSAMRIELKLEEVERGKAVLGQKVRVRVDAVPDQEFRADLDWISPIASVAFRGMGPSEKTFPARATLANLDPRLRPGMSASAEIIIESEANCLMIPARASFLNRGQPSVYVQRGQDFEIRAIQVGKRNEADLIVKSGLKEGETVALENPAEAARKAKKL